MIKSYSAKLHPVNIPVYFGEIKMLPFDLHNLNGAPIELKSLLKEMLSKLPIRKGIAFLTVDGKVVKRGETHRRGGAHIDGNYLHEFLSWGGGNGWKVGEGGRALTSEHHRRSYQSITGGMLIASNYQSCIGWNGTYDGEVGVGGDCTHLNLGEGFLLHPNTLYYGNSKFIHESAPINKTVQRT